MDSDRHRGARASIRAHAFSNWKEKLRRNCLERANEERAHLIWKIRSSAQNLNQKEILNSALRHLISDELRKIERPIANRKEDFSESNMNDLIWEYSDLQVNSYPGENEREEFLIEMERLLYEDLRKQLIKRELDAYEEEEEYLAKAVFENMHFNDSQIASGAVNDNQIWCPICKQGELKEGLQLIYCTHCDLRLDLESDKVNLDVLRSRLGEAYDEHLNRGCLATPSFCMEARFKIAALFLQCPVCQAFEIVL